ncbi:hypothetical protein BT93_F2526 [Corymbia citriodora subsp. variegata]|nr:hypothetical protein BT93_F2526 [Corymbia citriodora subsp. variegata]
MEIEGEEGSKVTLERAPATTVFGRGLGSSTDDRSVSRKHLLLQVRDEDGTAEPRVSFQVLGKNPVWVRSRSGGGIRVYRRSESGEIGVGERFCVSGRRPVWFDLRKIEDGGGSRSERNSGCESELAESAESVDISSIDPVKEFGFLVIGHEFDQYPKQLLRNAKHWDWFLEDLSKGSDNSGDEDEGTKAKHRGRRKRRRVEGNNGEDDEWIGESEDEKDVLASVRKAQKPSYLTRSKNNRQVKPPKSTKSDRTSQKKRSSCSEDDDVEDEEDNEMLGGFIVDDEDVEGEQEEEREDEEEEEEEFIDDEEDE